MALIWPSNTDSLFGIRRRVIIRQGREERKAGKNNKRKALFRLRRRSHKSTERTFTNSLQKSPSPALRDRDASGRTGQASVTSAPKSQAPDKISQLLCRSKQTAQIIEPRASFGSLHDSLINSRLKISGVKAAM